MDIDSLTINYKIENFILLRSSSLFLHNSVLKNIQIKGKYFIKFLSNEGEYTYFSVENSHFENILCSIKPFIYVLKAYKNIYSNNFLLLGTQSKF